MLIVAYGINDIGWGTKADDEHKQVYLDAIRGIVERCKERNVRVFICSAAITAEDPDTAEAGFLQRMCDEGMAVAREPGEGAIDVQRSHAGDPAEGPGRDEQAKDAKDRPTLHAADGVHLNDLGQLAMAFAILKGLGAPADVSSATVDAGGPALVEATGCRVTNVTGDAKRLEFDRLDEGLPVNFGVFGALQFRFVPIPEELNRYMLAVRGLPEGRYEMMADGRPLGSFAADRLAAGVNISLGDGRRLGAGRPVGRAGVAPDPADRRPQRGRHGAAARRRLPARPSREGRSRGRPRRPTPGWRTSSGRLVRPRPFHFVVRPAGPKTP